MLNYFNYFKHLVGSKMNEEKGQGMVEYALIIGLVSIVAMAILFTLGGEIKDVFTNIIEQMRNPVGIE